MPIIAVRQGIRDNPKKLGNTEGDSFIAIMAEIWNAPYALFCKIQGSMYM